MLRVVQYFSASKKKLILAKNWGKGDIYFHSYSVLIIHFSGIYLLSHIGQFLTATSVKLVRF